MRFSFEVEGPYETSGQTDGQAIPVLQSIRTTEK